MTAPVVFLLKNIDGESMGNYRGVAPGKIPAKSTDLPITLLRTFEVNNKRDHQQQDDTLRFNEDKTIFDVFIIYVWSIGRNSYYDKIIRTKRTIEGNKILPSFEEFINIIIDLFCLSYCLTNILVCWAF